MRKNLKWKMHAKTIGVIFATIFLIQFSGFGSAINNVDSKVYADDKIGTDCTKDEGIGVCLKQSTDSDDSVKLNLGKVENHNNMDTNNNLNNGGNENSDKQNNENKDKDKDNNKDTDKGNNINQNEKNNQNTGNDIDDDNQDPSENPGEDIEDNSLIGAPEINSFAVDKGENYKRLKLGEVKGSGYEYGVNINATEELKVCERSNSNKTMNKWFGITIKTKLNNNKLSYSTTGSNFIDLSQGTDKINYFIRANRTGEPNYEEVARDSTIYLKYSGTSDDSAIKITIHYVPFKGGDKPGDGNNTGNSGTSTNAIKSVSISGIQRVGKTLTAKINYSSKTPSVKPNISYQWLRCSKKDGEYKEISGANECDYKLKSSDEDCYIKVQVDLSGSITETKISDRTGAIDEKISGSGSGSSSGDFDNDFGNDKDDNNDSDKLTDEEMYMNTSYNSKVDKEMFELIKEYSYKSLLLEGSNCKWTFESSDMKNVSKMKAKFDAKIDTNSPNESEITKLTNGTSVINLYFNYNGILPGKAKVQVDVGSEHDGSNRYLYYYNPNTNLLELISSNVNIKKGIVTFTITHCSDYVLSETPIAGGVSNSNFDENSNDVDSDLNDLNNSSNLDNIDNLGNEGSFDNTQDTGTSGIKGQTYSKYNSSNSKWNQLSNGDWQILFNELIVTRWACMDNRWYYMNDLGIMQTGWINSGNNWYCLSESGEMLIGWQHLDGKWYYLKDTGEMAVGWQHIGGNWYYMYSNGCMAYSTGINEYELSESGAMY
ncbi:N-acetylmuramoyl-L-alanine amidase family protein [Clostridium uliginosum]|uniref:Putative cell wall binding repeat-containing protein n=1 Tax=Clostridium uliginosum TaxID=119641 RepID=A0A1I1Q310_9CLOT|nr:N-acetylmuramoyl-L-alanine amidase family protein [Clostridium uliginosum]SFD16536.1 Putative cell wall binding repeat-containing protein [Clostridium uliginosum]